MVYLEGRYSPQGDQGLKWEEDLGQTIPCPPGTSHAWACAGTGNRGSLDNPIFLLHGSQPRARIFGQPFLESWAPGTQEPTAQLRVLGPPNPELRTEGAQSSPFLLRRQLGCWTRLKMGSKDNMGSSPGSRPSLAIGSWASHLPPLT